jgi:hypothetical protein
LEQLPAPLPDLPFYRSAQIALAIRSGEISSAEAGIRSYLALRPRRLEMHLQLMIALFR